MWCLLRNRSGIPVIPLTPVAAVIFGPETALFRRARRDDVSPRLGLWGSAGLALVGRRLRRFVHGAETVHGPVIYRNGAVGARGSEPMFPARSAFLVRSKEMRYWESSILAPLSGRW